jgi:hypothetical protein
MKPQITLCAVSNVFTRMMHFLKAGDEEIGMKQTRAHQVLLSSGSLIVSSNNIDTTFNAPHMIYISEGKNYKLTALEDNTVATSIHAIREKTTGDIIDPKMIPAGTHPDFNQLDIEPIVLNTLD